jgi:type III secretory pathway component EscV
MVEASTTSGTMTGTGKATETNMWQPAPGFPIDPLFIAIAVVIVAIAAFLFMRRRKASTENTTPETNVHE